MHYVLAEPVKAGVLVFHTLTRALLLLTPEEYAAPDTLPELRDSWFRVPQEMKDQKYADHVRLFRRRCTKSPAHYQLRYFYHNGLQRPVLLLLRDGRSRIPMSTETAHKAADYIATHCGGEKVGIQWFGGEPLFNKAVIDIICNDLTAKGVEYHSTMISNGYLFDDATVKQAVELWKLKRIQITLDGTEDMYNRSKAFIYKNGPSPYQVVLTNIERLLDAGVAVAIRLNMDNHNAENLMLLADELHVRFAGRRTCSLSTVSTLFEFSGNQSARVQRGRRAPPALL